MTNVKYLVLLIILYLLSGCSEETLINYIDPPAPEERAQGVIKIKAEDYCKSLSTKNKNCLSASSVPDRLRV